jgi:hypothetical protein
MAVKPEEKTQLTIEWSTDTPLPDPRQFSSPSEFAHYACDNCGLPHKRIAIEIEMSASLLTQKLHGNTASLSADEYFRIARALVRLGKEKWGRAMFHFFAVQLLPPPGHKDRLRAERKILQARIERINEELDR